MRNRAVVTDTFFSESKEIESRSNRVSLSSRNKSSPTHSSNTSRDQTFLINFPGESLEKILANSQHTEEMSSSELSIRETRSERASDGHKLSQKRGRYKSTPKASHALKEIMKSALKKAQLEEHKVPD